MQLLSGDLSDFSIGKKAADLAAATWNRLDGLVVNHGVLEPVKKICDTDAEEWRAAFDVNVFSGVALVYLLFCPPTLPNLTNSTDQGCSARSARL